MAARKTPPAQCPLCGAFLAHLRPDPARAGQAYPLAATCGRCGTEWVNEAAPDPLCPRCHRAYPYGDPRSLVVGRQCAECDQRDSEARTNEVRDHGPLLEMYRGFQTADLEALRQAFGL